MLKKLYDKNNNPRDLEAIAELLNEGGVIIYPTDTTYAIGCHALKERAIERICQLKGLDAKKHLFSIVGRDLSVISEYVKIDNPAFKAMKRNLPGAFTFILPAGSRLPRIFKNRKEVGIRIPDNAIAMAICEAIDAPLLTTSLPYDEEEPEFCTEPELIDERFGDKVDMVIDGGPGDTEHSTVVNCVDGQMEIVRQGKGWLEF